MEQNEEAELDITDLLEKATERGRLQGIAEANSGYEKRLRDLLREMEGRCIPKLEEYQSKRKMQDFFTTFGYLDASRYIVGTILDDQELLTKDI
jgi:hypothetical protein